MASGLDKRLKRARQLAEDGTWEGLNQALKTVAPAVQEEFWDWYISAISRAPARVETRVKRLLAALGSPEVDLHGLWREPAQSVVCRVLNAHAAERVTFVTGKGKHSKCRQSILFSAVSKLLRDAGVSQQKSPEGTIAVFSTPECAATWTAYWRELCTEHKELPACERIEIASNPTDVGERHWNRSKQDGIERRKKLKKTRARQRLADARGEWAKIDLCGSHRG